MFKLLADIDDTGTYKRRWTTRKEIADVLGLATTHDPNLEIVIARFSDPHKYIRCDGAGPDDKIDVSHEALIRNWPRFVDWVAEEKTAGVAYTDLTDNYRSWKKRCANISDSTLRFLSQIFTTNLDRRLAARVERELGLSPWKWPSRGNTARAGKGRPTYRTNTEWAKRYQSGDDGELYDAVLHYYQVSQRKRIVARASVFSLLMLVTLLSVGLLIYRQDAEIASQQAELSAQSETMFRYETMFFHPLVVASKIRFLDGNTPEIFNYAAVWQAAVALKSVHDVQGSFYGGTDTVGGKNWDAKRWTRLVRAIRLAHEGANGAARMVSSAVLWPRQSLDGQNEYQLLSGETPDHADDDVQLLLSACDAPNRDQSPGTLVFHQSRPESTSRWDAAVFDSSKPLCIAKKHPQGGWRKVFEVPWTLQPAGDSVWLDPHLRFYVISRSYPASGLRGPSRDAPETTTHALKLQRLIWYEVLPESSGPNDGLKKPSIADNSNWKLIPGPVFTLNFKFPFEVSVVGSNGEHLRIKQLECEESGNAPCEHDYLIRWDVDQQLVASPPNELDTCNYVSGNPDPDVIGTWLCGEDGQYQLVEKKGNSEVPQPDLHRLEVQMSMGKPGDSPTASHAFKSPYPVAQFQFYGSDIEDVRFSGSGEIYLRTSLEKNRDSIGAHRIIWGGDALLQVLCDVLEQHPAKAVFTRAHLGQQQAFSPAFQELSGIQDAIVNKFHEAGPCS